MKPNCSVIDSIAVGIYEVSNPELPYDTASCQYNCIYLVAQNGIDYLWNTGDTNDSLLVCIKEEEKYWVDITNTHGCKSSDTTKVIPIPSTEAYIYDLIPVFCSYEDSVKLHGYPFGGKFVGNGVSHWDEDYYFDPQKVDPGAYDLIYAYTNEFECTYNDTVNLWVFEQPYVDLGDDTTVCNNDMLTLSAPEGFDSYCGLMAV